MNLLSIQFSGAEIGVWAALLFSSGVVLHFWWTQRQIFSSDLSQPDKRSQQESEKWKNRFLQETELLSRELERLRKELESSNEKYQSLQSALQSKSELLQHLQIEHRAYRELLTNSLQAANPPAKRSEARLIPAFPQPRPDGNPNPGLTEELNRAENRIQELELRLLDKEEELERMKQSGVR